MNKIDNHLHLQILMDESIVYFDIAMGRNTEPIDVLKGAAATNRRMVLKDVKIIWLDDEWDQIVFQADGEQYVGTYQIIDHANL